MTKKSTERSLEKDQAEKAEPSDGYTGKAVLLAAASKYDFRELGAYVGKVG